MMRSLSVVVALSAAFWMCVAHAATPRDLKWDDLVPQLDVLEDPLSSLTADQAIDFDIVAAFRQEGPSERTPENASAFEDAEKSEKSLRKQGIDFEAIYKKYQAWQVAKEKQGNTLVSSLDDATVRIAGYLLPLDVSDKGVSEFLLVPYVGACIHVPPPPANQMVFVSLEQSYKVDGLYVPVWVTGKMKAKKTEKTLTLADGASTVPVGYTLHGMNVEPYKKQKKKK
ncbi:MAG: DUF3299 domain-containing protein [Hyphomicrobiaceae bacterium]